MDLKNVTPFDRFRKVFEVTGEFSNKTGFSESLIGRGLFSIIRFFKQGINIGRLEYLKRKLENEYFAGWLRFCALKNINIKDGTMPKTPPSDDGGSLQMVVMEMVTVEAEEMTMIDHLSVKCLMLPQINYHIKKKK